MHLYHVLKFIKYFLTSFIIKAQYDIFFPLRNMNPKMAGTTELRSER